VDLIEPASREELVEAVREAGRAERRLLVVGGGTHLDRGNPSEVDAHLSTLRFGRLVWYDPAEMITVVEAGMRVGDLDAALAEGGQEWPVDAPRDATVGGVIASGTSSPRRLRVGAMRDTVLEVELVTGDGRIVKGGGRTVKNVSGYDMPRLMAGSLGTLGVIVQVALKLRPRPKLARTLVAAGGAEAGRRLLEAVPLTSGVLAGPDRVEVRVEGWPEDVEEQTRRALATVGNVDVVDGGPFPTKRPWADRPVVVEASVPPSRVAALSEAAGDTWGALLGVGVLWAGLPTADGELEALRARAAAEGGVAPVVSGPGGLGASPPAVAVHRRLKAAFDPSGILAPGRFWGGL
jgi:glycolate oxidase FAD binding subunit